MLRAITSRAKPRGVYHSTGKRTQPANRNAPIPKHTPTAISCRRSEPWTPARRGLLRLFKSGRTPNSMTNTPLILLDLPFSMAAILSRTWLVRPALLCDRRRHDCHQFLYPPHGMRNASFHHRGDAKRSLNSAEIVLLEVKGDCRRVIIDLLREGIARADKTPHQRPHGELLTLHE